MINVADFMAEYREKRAKDIAETVIYTIKGWSMSHHGRIVFYCPACAAKIGADAPDLSEGPQDEQYYECEECGAEIRLVLEWRIEPDLVGVHFFAPKDAQP